MTILPRLLITLLICSTSLFADDSETPTSSEDPVATYRHKAEEFRQKAAETQGEISDAYTTLANNYDRMSAIKRDAAEKADRGDIMDWSEYHRIEGMNRRTEARLRELQSNEKPKDQVNEAKSDWDEKVEDVGEKEHQDMLEESEPEKPKGFQIRTRIGK